MHLTIDLGRRVSGSHWFTEHALNPDLIAYPALPRDFAWLAQALASWWQASLHNGWLGLRSGFRSFSSQVENLAAQKIHSDKGPERVL